MAECRKIMISVCNFKSLVLEDQHKSSEVQGTREQCQYICAKAPRKHKHRKAKCDRDHTPEESRFYTVVHGMSELILNAKYWYRVMFTPHRRENSKRCSMWVEKETTAPVNIREICVVVELLIVKMDG